MSDNYWAETHGYWPARCNNCYDQPSSLRAFDEKGQYIEDAQQVCWPCYRNSLLLKRIEALVKPYAPAPCDICGAESVYHTQTRDWCPSCYRKELLTTLERVRAQAIPVVTIADEKETP